MNQRSPALQGSTPGILVVRVLLSIGAVAAMLLVSFWVQAWVPYTQMSFFVVAVLFSAWVGGFALGAFSIVLSIIAAEMVLFPPLGLALGDLLTGRLAAWAAVALVVVWVVDRLTMARRRGLEQQAEAERLATELRQQAREMTSRAEEARTLALELERSNVRLTEQSDTLRLAAARSERLQRFTAQLLGRVGAASVASLIVDEGRRAVDASAAALVLARDGEPDVVAAHGFPDEDLLLERTSAAGTTPLMEAIESGEPIWLEDEAALLGSYPSLANLRRNGSSWAALPLQLDGRRIGALALAFERAGPFTPEHRAFMLLIAQQCAQAVERARLHDMELLARIRAEFAERRLSLLAEASARLAASLDYLASLANLAHIVVPEIADWCVVHLIDDDGVLRLIAVAHTDPDLVRRRRELEERYPASLQDRTAQARALRTGELVSIEPVTDEYLSGVARDSEHLDDLRSFDVRSQLSVPLRIEDRVCGVVTFANAESGRRFAESDITLVQELGRRASHAVENARLYQAAHHASEAKSDFLAVMSHELRTPLNAIIGYSDLLLMGVPRDVPDQARRQVERIRSASTSLLHLVEEVLSFSRVEAGKEDIRISPVELGTVVRDCVALIEPLASEKRLDLRIDLPVEPLKVVSDERKIRQILTNLLSNAVKFTETGAVVVRARSVNGEVAIEVADTGIGISAENLERIFEPFWQVEQSATRRFGGTGLGLGVARKLAKLLEGRLEVRSEVGVGSTFSLILPVHTPGVQKLG